MKPKLKPEQPVHVTAYVKGGGQKSESATFYETTPQEVIAKMVRAVGGRSMRRRLKQQPA